MTQLAVEALTITPDQARRFLVRRHLLDPPRALPAEPESVLRVVDRLGFLQFDPLEVPGARNHDLVLHARIAGYRREWCERWLYGPPGERRFFEAYNKSLNILPLSELPYYRIGWDRASEYTAKMLDQQRDVADAILRRIEAEGPLSTASFTEHKGSIDWWWAPTRVSRAVLEALFVSGRVGISRREGNRRFYDLVERLFPADVLAQRVPPEASMRHRLISRFKSVGLIGGRAQAEVLLGTGKAPERAAGIAGLVADGTLMAVAVEGLPGVRHALADERPLLEEVVREPAPTADRGVAFVAPLDPLVWDRRQLRELFEFDYLWEVYVPESRRRYGYYVLPILYGDRFVGRIEPRIERVAGTLRILRLSFEPWFAPREEKGFLPALGAALTEYLRFVGASRLEWPEGVNPGVEVSAEA